jgi:hypothetical protein
MLQSRFLAIYLMAKFLVRSECAQRTAGSLANCFRTRHRCAPKINAPPDVANSVYSEIHDLIADWVFCEQRIFGFKNRVLRALQNSLGSFRRCTSNDDRRKLVGAARASIWCAILGPAIG